MTQWIIVSIRSHKGLTYKMHKTSVWNNDCLVYWCIYASSCLGELFHMGFKRYNKMTSSNENIFRVSGPLWGESIGHRWIPLTKAGDAELWYFLWSAPDQTTEQTAQMPVIWDAVSLIVTSLWWSMETGNLNIREFMVVEIPFMACMSTNELKTLILGIILHRGYFTKGCWPLGSQWELYPWMIIHIKSGVRVEAETK